MWKSDVQQVNADLDLATSCSYRLSWGRAQHRDNAALGLKPAQFSFPLYIIGVFQAAFSSLEPRVGLPLSEPVHGSFKRTPGFTETLHLMRTESSLIFTASCWLWSPGVWSCDPSLLMGHLHRQDISPNSHVGM